MKLGEREGQVATSKHVVFCCWERKGGGWLLLVCVCLAPSGRIVMAFVINRIDEQSKFEIFYFCEREEVHGELWIECILVLLFLVVVLVSRRGVRNECITTFDSFSFSH